MCGQIGRTHRLTSRLRDFLRSLSLFLVSVHGRFPVVCGCFKAGMGVAAAARLSRYPAPVFATVLLLLLCHVSHAAGQPVGQAVVVQNGYEFHAALTSPGVTWILLASNVSPKPKKHRV